MKKLLLLFISFVIIVGDFEASSKTPQFCHTAHSQAVIGDILKRHYAIYKDEFIDWNDEDIELMADKINNIHINQEKSEIIIITKSGGLNDNGIILYQERIFNLGSLETEKNGWFTIWESDELANPISTEITNDKPNVPISEFYTPYDKLTETEKQETLRNYRKNLPYFVDFDTSVQKGRQLMKDWRPEIIDSIKQSISMEPERVRRSKGGYFQITLALVENGRLKGKHYNSRTGDTIEFSVNGTEEQ